MSYFKFQTEAALAAWDHVEAQTADLQKTGQAFAELFGGKAVFQYTVTSRWFTGNYTRGNSEDVLIAIRGAGLERSRLAAVVDRLKEDIKQYRLDRWRLHTYEQKYGELERQNSR